MAGFAQIGEPGFRISPPLLGASAGSTGYLGLPISRPRRGYASFYDPTQYSYNTGADTSQEHSANVYLKQMGIGDLYSQQDQTLPQYGFSAEDWTNLNRYLSNPLDQNNVNSYMGLVNRTNQNINQNPGFSRYTPDMRAQFARDMPIRVGAGYNIPPPAVLQNWALPYPSIPGMRF
jgi:hypothetical protein